MSFRNKKSVLILLFSAFFKMAASIGSHIGNKNHNIFITKNPISMRFASKYAVFQILLFRTCLYFCVWEQPIRCSATPCILLFFRTRSVDSEIHDHSCKILFVNKNGNMFSFLFYFRCINELPSGPNGLLILYCKI